MKTQKKMRIAVEGLVAVFAFSASIASTISWGGSGEANIVCTNPEQVRQLERVGQGCSGKFTFLCQETFVINEAKKAIYHIGSDGRKALVNVQFDVDIIAGEVPFGASTSADEKISFSQYARWKFNRLTGQATSFRYVYRDSAGRDLPFHEVKLKEQETLATWGPIFGQMPQDLENWECEPTKSKF